MALRTRHRPRRARRPPDLRLLFVAVLLLATISAVVPNLLSRGSLGLFDLEVYQCYAHAFWDGAASPQGQGQSLCSTTSPAKRLSNFPREYPPSALIVFSLPFAVPWLSYADAYSFGMALCLLAAIGLLAWRGPPEAAIAIPLYLLLAGWAFIFERYDLLPGLLVLLALICLQQQKMGTATVALALGTSLKLFPIVLFPLVLIRCLQGPEKRLRLDLVALFVAICVASVLPALILNPDALLGPLRFEAARPLHIESLPGSLLWLAQSWLPGASASIRTEFSYNSLNVAGSAQGAIGAVTTAVGVLGILLAYRRAWQGQDSSGRSFVVILAVVLATGKVFSPQYVLWLLPVAALVEGLRLRWLIVALLVNLITYCYTTIALADLPDSPFFLGVLIARNLFVAALAVLYLATPGDLATARWPVSALWRRLAQTVEAPTAKRFV